MAVIFIASALPGQAAGDETGFLGFSPLETVFFEALALIVTACVFVPLSNRFGFGTVIGYLVAGVFVGTALSLSFSTHPEELLHFAEFGIVLFLFVIGLEFRPARLWELRGTILGRGLVQVLATGAALGGAAYVYGLDWRASVIVGLGLALSSTALVMQDIDAKNERHSDYGQTAISVLLFEDLAIVPLLMLVALLAPVSEATSTAETLSGLSLGVLAIFALILIGRYLVNPVFDVVARTRTPELMTASALGVVIAASLLMATVGLSYALGAFIAGVMLASSAYRHEVEADIEPFRALFLGLFFIAVGLTLDLHIVVPNAGLILLAVPILICVKGAVIYCVSRIFRTGHPNSLRLALGLSQHGEFGFVLFAAAAAAGVLDAETSAIAISIVTLSMALSSQSDKLLSVFTPAHEREEIDEDYSDASGRVLIIGFGRVGQMAAQPLLMQSVPLTLLDNDADRVREAARFGARVHFGDGTRQDVLRSAGAEAAQVIVVATDDPDITQAIATLVRKEFPSVRLVLRAFDRVHAVRLSEGGSDVIVRETGAASLELGRETLVALGYTETEASEVGERVAEKDKELLNKQMLAARDVNTRAEVIAQIQPEALAARSD
ncbi:MAG: monovalent cation:proton antiporter-2 (CPA2) family protein [Pseudomonadota bacterium]